MGTQAQGRRGHGDAGTWGRRDEGTREAFSSWKAIEGILPWSLQRKHPCYTQTEPWSPGSASCPPELCDYRCVLWEAEALRQVVTASGENSHSWRKIRKGICIIGISHDNRVTLYLLSCTLLSQAHGEHFPASHVPAATTALPAAGGWGASRSARTTTTCSSRLPTDGGRSSVSETDILWHELH